MLKFWRDVAYFHILPLKSSVSLILGIWNSFCTEIGSVKVDGMKLFPFAPFFPFYFSYPLLSCNALLEQDFILIYPILECVLCQL